MLVVHHLENSRSQRVLWLLEELDLPYEVRHYRRDPATLLAPASLRAVHPLGKSPVVTDGEATIAESGAILEYLLDRYGHGRLRPADESDRRRYVYWMHYAEASAMPPLLLKLVFDRLEAAPMPIVVRSIARAIARRVKETFVAPQIALHLDFMEAELSKTAWFAGSEFSAADIQMSFPVEAAVARGGLDRKRPALMAWRDRVHARAAWQRAIAKGGALKLGG